MRSLSTQWWVRGYRAALALLTLIAIAVQLQRSTSSGFSPASFFSFFTIESNLIVGAVLLLAWLVVTVGGRLRVVASGTARMA